MSEILYCAKRVDCGEWVYGYPVRKADCTGSVWFMYVHKTDPDSNSYEVEIDPETISRFTGLTDRNGKRLFEGNICRFTDYSMSLPGTFIGTIKYYKNIIAVFESGDYSIDLCEWKSGDFEVIGNIYDTPELIGDDTA